MLTTALITLAVPVLLSGMAHAEDLYLNNGPANSNEYTQESGVWDENARIWSRQNDFGSRRRLDRGDTAILVARPNASPGDIRLTLAGEVVARELRIDSSGYALVSDGDRDTIFRGAWMQGASGPELRLVFPGSNGDASRTLDLAVALGGNIIVQGPGQINYSGESRAQTGSGFDTNGMTHLNIRGLSSFATTGTTAGQLNVDGRFMLSGAGSHAGNADIRQGGTVSGEGVLDGTVTNNGTLNADRGASGGSNTLSTGAVTNGETGVIGADADSTLRATSIDNNGGIVNATNRGTITIAQGGRLTNNGDGALNVTGGGAFNGAVDNKDTGTVSVNTGGVLTGDIINSGEGDVTVGADGRVVGNISNESDTSTVTVAENGRIEGNITRNDGTATIDGRVTGDVRNSASTGDVVVGGSGRIGSLTVTNGTATVNGTVDGRVDVGANGTVVLSDNSTSGNVVNRGNVTIAGDVVDGVDNFRDATLGSTTANDRAVIVGDYRNREGAETTLIGSTLVSGNFTNAGNLSGQAAADTTLDIAGTFESTGSITGVDSSVGSATITITAAQVVFGASHVLSGNVVINGAIANGGTILYDDTAGHAMNGSLMNTPGGTVDVITSLNGNGNNVINHSNYNVMAGGTATGIAHFANRQGGTLDIRADAATGTTGSLTATTITNDVGGTINNAGTLTADLLRSNGTLNSTGTLNGRVAIGRDGDAVLSNVITGQLHNSGDFSTGGNLSVGGFVNAGEGEIVAGHVMTVQGPRAENTVGTLTVNGTLAGSLLNRDNGTVVLGGGTVTGDVANRSGMFTGAGNVLGTMTNQADGTIDVDRGNTLTVTGTTTNRGTMDIGGTYAGAISNVEGGTIALDGGALTGAVDNQAILTGNGSLTQRLVNSGAGRVVAGAGQTLDLQGGVDNRGEIALSGGTINGVIDNQLLVGGNGTLTGLLNNMTGGVVEVDRGERLQLNGGASNIGTFNVAGRVAGHIDNQTAGVIALNGGNLEGTVTNTGSISGGGQVSGVVTNQGTGTVTVANTDRLNVTGRIDNTATISVAGRLAGQIANLDGGTLAFQGGILENGLRNGGTITGTGLIEGRLDNLGSGVVDIARGQQLAARNGTVNQGRVTVAGQLDGALNNTTGTVTLDGGVLTGAVTNNNRLEGRGSLLQGLTNNGTAELSGMIAGRTENNNTLTTTGDLRVETLVNNADATTLVSSGTRLSTANTIANNQDATLTVDGVVAFDSNRAPDPNVALIDNAGTLSGSGHVDGVVLNRGILDMTGTINRIVNQGEATLSTGETLSTTGGVQNGNLLTNAGRLNSNVTNEATLVSSGVMNGTLSNIEGGTATLSGSVSAIENGGSLQTAGDLSVRRMLNIADVRVQEGHNLTAAEMVRNSGTLALAGRLTGDLGNTGTLALERGVVDGSVTSNGQITGAGRITGTLFNNADLTLNDRLRVGTLQNNRRLTVARGRALVADEAVVNLGTFDLLGQLQGNLVNEAGHVANLGGRTANNGALISGNVANAGRLNLHDMTIGGVLTNTGDVNMQNRNDSGRLNVAGIAGNGEYRLDLDLEQMTADRITVSGGPVTGNLSFDFDILSNSTVNRVGERVTIMDLDPSQRNSFTFGYDPISLSSARVVYEMVRNPGSGDLEVVSGTNPAIGALLGNVALTHSLIGSVINRPNSPYVVGMAYEDEEKPCGIGSWGRALGGTATANGATDNGVASYDSEVKAKYYGMQVGTDLACFNGHFNGWNMAFGALLGVNQGTTDQPNYLGTTQNSASRTLASITTSDFDQIYGGVYVTATKDNWTVDLQYRHEVTNFDIDNRAVAGNSLGLSDANFSSRANTISGALSYMLPIAETGWQFVPSAGFAWSKFSIDDIRFTDGYKLEFEDGDRKVGFFGGTVTKTYVDMATDSALNVFATGTYYKDFADETRSIFSLESDPDFAPQYLKSDHLGAYTEVSVGANYVKILSGQFGKARQLSAGTRIDARFGDNLDSVGVTGQIRLQF